MWRCKTDAFQAGNFVYRLEQFHETGFADVFTSITGHDLSEQGDLFDAVRYQPFNLLDNLRNGPAAFRAARVRHDAKRAIHLAALHNADECRNLPVAIRTEHVIADGRFAPLLRGDVHDAERLFQIFGGEQLI